MQLGPIGQSLRVHTQYGKNFNRKKGLTVDFRLGKRRREARNIFSAQAMSPTKVWIRWKGSLSIATEQIRRWRVESAQHRGSFGNRPADQEIGREKNQGESGEGY